MQKQLELLKKYEIEVKGIRGQHFLIDPNIQRKIVQTVNPKPGETIVEIGPGLGALTEKLLESGAEVIAVESDKRFCEILKSEYGPAFPNLTVVHADILQVNFEHVIASAAKFAKKTGGIRPDESRQIFGGQSHERKLPRRSKDLLAMTEKKIKVVGNLPYYITSPIIFLLASNRKLIDTATIMVQKEIAERLLAQPGTKDYGRLTLFARFYSEVWRAFDVSRGCFSPKPKVDSSVVQFTFRTKEVPVNETLLFEIIKHAFGHRRKNMANALSYGLKDLYPKEVMESALKTAGIDPKARGESLMIKDFLKLTEVLEKGHPRNL